MSIQRLDYSDVEFENMITEEVIKGRCSIMIGLKKRDIKRR